MQSFVVRGYIFIKKCEGAYWNRAQIINEAEVKVQQVGPDIILLCACKTDHVFPIIYAYINKITCELIDAINLKRHGSYLNKSISSSKL